MIYKNRNKHFTIRIHEGMHNKLRYIAKYEGRTMNHQIIYLIHHNILYFEEKYGSILTKKEKE